MVKSMPAVTRVVDGREDFEASGKALGIVGFVGISWHSGKLKAQDRVYKAVRMPLCGISLMEGPWSDPGKKIVYRAAFLFIFPTDRWMRRAIYSVLRDPQTDSNSNTQMS